MTAGVYCIMNVATNMMYVGCSIRIEERWERHAHQLEQRRHPNFRLQQAFDQSPDDFAFIILEVTDPDNTYRREQVWFDRMIRHHELYNLDLIVPEDLQVSPNDQQN